jgi:hypothetical protein
MRRLAFAALTAAALCAPAIAQPQRSGGLDNIASQTAQQIQAGIENKHPAAYYALAKRLFESGARDEAVFWFYAGQIRWRAYLMGNPQLPRDGDPALFASLSEVVGRPLNQYAFGDIAGLAKTIDRALEWDASHPDRYVKVSEREKSRSGLMGMKTDMLARADEIRATRVKNGLSNRTQ